MSGGSFDYAYRKLQTFASELEDRMAEDIATKYWSKDTVVCLQDIVAEARYLARIMRAVEWMYSGDVGEDYLRLVLAQGKDGTE